MTKRTFSVATALLALTTAAQADMFHTTDGSIDGSLCVGDACITDEVFNETLKLSEVRPEIYFEDTSNTSSFPTNNWRIQINDTVDGGGDFFRIRDHNGNTNPFQIDAGAPTDSLRIADASTAGNPLVGIGEANPQAPLHITNGTTPGIVLERDTTGGSTAQKWEVASTSTFFIQDLTAGGIPFQIIPGAPNFALTVHSDGDIAMGTNFVPSNSLWIHRTDGTASIKLEEASTTRANRDMLILENNGRPRIVLRNDRTDNPARAGEWIMSAGDTFVVQNRSGGMTENVYIIDADGNLIIEGEIITSGATCGSGCDAVFSDDYDVKPIAVHAAEMFELGYLPNVGPTPENEPINLSDKLGRMLNELEHAHIYIAELETEKAKATAERAALAQMLATQQAELEAMKTLLLSLAD